jgi:predicted secreted protein
MSASSSFAIYIIIWWLVLFMVLPIGAARKIDAQDIEDGQDAGAPAKPMLGLKLILTTAISMAFFAVFYVLYVGDYISFRPE